MKYEFIKISEQNKDTATIILSNIKVKNALNPVMIKEIIKVIKILKKNKTLRALIITGEGDTFSAGADLEWMRRSKKLSFKENKLDANIFNNMLKEIYNFPCPTISLVNGHAFGGGIGIISATDFSISIDISK